MTTAEPFDRDVEAAIRQILDELGWLVGAPVALVVIRDPDGSPSFIPHPLVGHEVFAAMAHVDWLKMSQDMKLIQP